MTDANYTSSDGADNEEGCNAFDKMKENILEKMCEEYIGNNN